MTTLLAHAFVPVPSLRPGLTIRYGGELYSVAEVLPVAVLSGHVVVAFPVDAVDADTRVGLVYAQDNALAELIDVGGAL